MKTRWLHFGTPAQPDGLPRLLYAGSDEVTTPAYRWDGSRRSHASRAVFQFSLRGTGCLEWAGGTCPVGPGQAFCYDLGDPGFSYFYPPDGNEPWAFVYAVFVGMTELVSRLVARQGPVFQLGESNPAVQRLCCLLDTESTPGPRLDASRHFELCTGLVGELIRASETETGGGRSEELVRQAEELIRGQTGRPFCLGAVAARLCVTPEHLCRAFRRLRGTTPMSYHNELRLERICERLLASNATCKEIAGDEGFTDCTHFGKFFKAHRGLTPGEFRRIRTLHQ